MVCDRCAPDLNVTTRPLLDDTIKCAFQVVLGDYLPNYLPSPPHFCSIVAVVEVDGTSQTLVTTTYRAFQESETRGDRFRANPYAQQRCSGVGIMLAHHLGGLLVVEVGSPSMVRVCAILLCRCPRCPLFTPEIWSFRLPLQTRHSRTGVRSNAKVEHQKIRSSNPTQRTTYLLPFRHEAHSLRCIC